MSADSTTDYDVHLGAWTDWSRGAVYGATLTLTRQDGNLVIAFVAFYVASVGTRFWRIACLILHYIYSSDGARDGVHHQRQVFLRNAPNAEAALWTLAGIGLSWGKIARQVWTRLILIIGMALACIVGFALAGGFSSRIATFFHNEVLFSGANCGVVQGDSGITSFSNTQGPLYAQSVMAAESYARQCYTASPVPSVSCGTYVRKKLTPDVLDNNANCPFDEKTCKRPDKNLFIDTGRLDTHRDFGRNSPPDRRLQYRRTLHCAPLATDGYRFRTYNTQNESYTTYYYGQLQNTNGSTNNYTAHFSNDMYADLEELTRNDGNSTRDFDIRYVNSVWYNGSVSAKRSSFFPVAELRPQNANLYLVFLTTGHLLFGDPIQDDWYHATGNTTQIHKTQLSKEGNATVYRQSEPGSPLACKEQHQYCYQDKCTPLASDADADWDLLRLIHDEDEPWVNWLMRTGFVMKDSIWSVLARLHVHALIARNNLNGQIMGKLPDNQWQLEVQHWHATTMAHLQGVFLDAIVGHSGPSIQHLLRTPKSATEREICANQKILSEGFVSISTLGITCVLLGGGVIICLSFVLDPLLSGPCCWNRSARYRYSKMEWSTNETLLQQRLAQEGSGIGTWSRGTKSVPITRTGERLAVLDLTDPAHPRLRTYEMDEDEDGDGRS